LKFVDVVSRPVVASVRVRSRRRCCFRTPVELMKCVERNRWLSIVSGILENPADTPWNGVEPPADCEATNPSSWYVLDIVGR
jgi:hypothetical protein